MSRVRLLYACAVLAGAAVPALGIERLVRVGLHDAAPLAYRDRSGAPAGFGVEIIDYIARQEGWTLQYVEDTWDGCVGRLRTGQIDLLFPMSWTVERSALFDFSEQSLIQSWGRVFARRDSGIEGILDLEGQTIAVVRGDIFNADIRDLTERFGVSCTFIEKPTKTEVLKCIVRGEADAGAIEGKSGSGPAAEFDIVPTSIVFSPRKPLVAATKARGLDLLRAIDRHLEALKADRESVYYRAYDNWFDIVSGPAPALSQGLKWTLLIAASLLALTLVFALMLRVQVQAKTRALLEEVAVRRRISDELVRSEERLEYALQVTSDGLWDVNLQNGDMFVSRRWRETLGYGPDEIDPTVAAWESLVHPEDMPRVRKALAAHVSGDSPIYECENRLRTKSGTYRWNLDRGKIVEWDDQGQPLRMVGVDADITRRKSAEQERGRLEEQLRQAQKMEAVGQLAGGIAHDFSNLLMVISAHTTLVRSRLAKTPELQESLQTIEDAVKHATGVTHSLLTFSRRMPVSKSPVDLCAAVRGTERMLARTLPASIDLRVETQCDPHPWVEADETQLQQVLLNLAINGRDAMPAGGRLTIRVDTQSADGELPYFVPPLSDEMVRVTVSDTGQGMSAEVRSRIFEPFFTTKAREQRTGLGLAIIHGIVKDHAGHIMVRSEEGRGALFAIDLPVTARRPEAPHVDGGAVTASGRGEFVVLAEANQQIREVLAAYLVDLGYAVHQVGDGAELLSVMRSGDRGVDLVVMDIEMPRINGMDCLETLRSEGHNMPAVLMTGSVAEVESCGPDVAVLIKPFHLDQLGQLTRRFIRHEAEGNT